VGKDNSRQIIDSMIIGKRKRGTLSTMRRSSTRARKGCGPVVQESSPKKKQSRGHSPPSIGAEVSGVQLPPLDNKGRMSGSACSPEESGWHSVTRKWVPLPSIEHAGIWTILGRLHYSSYQVSSNSLLATLICGIDGCFAVELPRRDIMRSTLFIDCRRQVLQRVFEQPNQLDLRGTAMGLRKTTPMGPFLYALTFQRRVAIHFYVTGKGL